MTMERPVDRAHDLSRVQAGDIEAVGPRCLLVGMESVFGIQDQDHMEQQKNSVVQWCVPSDQNCWLSCVWLPVI